jgi:hypothetical protein
MVLDGGALVAGDTKLKPDMGVGVAPSFEAMSMVGNIFVDENDAA